MDPAAEYVRIPVTPGSKIYGIGKCALNSWLRQRWTKHFEMLSLHFTKVFEIFQIQSVACILIFKFRGQQFILIECNKWWLPLGNYKICCFISFDSRPCVPWSISYFLHWPGNCVISIFVTLDMICTPLFGLIWDYTLKLFWCKDNVRPNSARESTGDRRQVWRMRCLCLAVSC